MLADPAKCYKPLNIQYAVRRSLGPIEYVLKGQLQTHRYKGVGNTSQRVC